MIFLAHSYEYGTEYCKRLEANSWEEAEQECIARKWELDGELIAEIPADRTSTCDVNMLVVQMNKRILN